MKEKRQTKANPAPTDSKPNKKGGGVLGGLALLLALGSGGVSAYLYTELQKFRNQTNDMVETTSSELKTSMQTELEGVRSDVASSADAFNSRLETALSELSGQLDLSVTELNDRLGTSVADINSQFEARKQALDTELQTMQTELSGSTEKAVKEVASNTALAVQELTNRTDSEISSLNSQLTNLGSGLSTLDTSLSAVSSELNQQNTSIQENFSTKLTGIEETINKLNAEILATHELATRGQRDWILAEVEYLLRTGGHRVILAGDTKSAVLAFRSASDRLHDLGDSRYTPVREQISEEVAELRQTGTPDIEGIAFELQKLSKRADTLPLPPTELDIALDQAKEDPSKIDTKAVTNQLLESLKGLVKVEKADGTPRIRPAKPTKEQLSASEALRLNLQAARLSALRRDPQTYVLHVESAEDYVRQNYHQENPLTIAFLEDLAVMKAQPIVPVVSSLGQALQLFTQIHSQRGEN